jgi:AraC family transcriptional regulator of adaptative response / DNA-3-methyladenine glycosylase II
MVQDNEALYSALAARDPRFDGVFYVGVTSTGIYCRNVCTAKLPKAANCRFFNSAEAAEKSNFRPCLRCRPELAPGNAPMDDAHRIGAMIAQRIAEGSADEGEGIESIAAQFGWSSRQIRRMLQKSLGVSPMELVLTRRLLLAKQLLTETDLSITEVVFASGFASLRRFNDAFGERYGMPPTRFRKATTLGASVVASADANRGTLSLLLSYRTPFDWSGLLTFLRTRTLAGVEVVTDDTYARTVRLGERTGWVRVHDVPVRRALSVELPHALTPALPALLGRLRHLFDLSARPDIIDAHLATDALLAPQVARTPGLRVPGAFDGFELALRAILGQQVTVKAATTIAGRFAEAFGDALDAKESAAVPEGLARLTPRAERVAVATVDEVASLGIVRTRAASIIAVANEVASGRLRLEPGAPPEPAMAQLTALSGIGPWTAHYIAMRALRAPDAFPKEDVALQKALGGVSAARAEEMSQAWRPWRSYATLHLWGSLRPLEATPVSGDRGDAD